MKTQRKTSLKTQQLVEAALQLANNMKQLGSTVQQTPLESELKAKQKKTDWPQLVQKLKDEQKTKELLRSLEEIETEETPATDLDTLMAEMTAAVEENPQQAPVLQQAAKEDEAQAQEMETAKAPESPEQAQQVTAQMEKIGRQAETENAPAAKPEEKQAQTMRNALQYVGGLPSSDAIRVMAGGLQEEKLGKHKGFLELFAALDKYGAVMQTPLNTRLDAETANDASAGSKKTLVASAGTMEKFFGKEALQAPVQALREVILCAEKAVSGVSGFALGHSSNMKKLVPVVSSLLMQCYGMLPKVANLQQAIVPYAMKYGADTVRWDHILADSVAQGYGDRLSAPDVAEQAAGSKTLTRAQAFSLLKASKSKKSTGQELQKIANKSKKAQKSSLQTLTVPAFPFGIISEKLSPEQQQQQANKMADRYLRHLRALQHGLDDMTEMNAQVDDRTEVNAAKSDYFHLSKLIAQVSADRDRIVSSLLAGGRPQMGEPLAKLNQFGGLPLEAAARMAHAEDVQNATKLDTSASGNFKVGGGAASVSILDFKEGRVLRSPKDAQGDAAIKPVSGMHDEAVGKISQFLGFNVVATAEARSFVDADGKLRDKGSVMKLAAGKVARGLHIANSADQEASTHGRTYQSGEKTYYDPIQAKGIQMQGRLLGDIQKMNVVDYLTAHRDRHTGNFMVNLDAAEGESTITAIDNDMVFGLSSGKLDGFTKTVNTLSKMKGRSIETFQTMGKLVFTMITPEVKQAMDALDVEALGAMLEPYVNRTSRYGVMQRARELKKMAACVPVADLTTEKGVAEYLHTHYKLAMEEYFEHNHINDKEGENIDSNLTQFGGSTLMMLNTQSFGSKQKGLPFFTTMAEVIFRARTMNLTKDEIVEIISQKAFAATGEKMGDIVLARPEIKEVLADYDLPFEEFFAKHGKKEDFSKQAEKAEAKKA